ncbi:hypothetical protein XAP412_370121 [Xanthomonas phaseoli pv. phaseoli]|uniref:Uncharacterized protein n=1 Tax=Xanthomonas campestris pv. phaseoli TaxID=317013 RepID=A0AB38E1F9_XANCH|nr:hypothetical protein XAP412_370121 [Xanthomonas phaseoli pv. phaseoli]SON89127.1 hypothetical protein XAP7430_400189 [Xanthomonas phaseoli pv. phaseoli]
MGNGEWAKATAPLLPDSRLPIPDSRRLKETPHEPLAARRAACLQHRLGDRGGVHAPHASQAVRAVVQARTHARRTEYRIRPAAAGAGHVGGKQPGRSGRACAHRDEVPGDQRHRGGAPMTGRQNSRFARRSRRQDGAHAGASVTKRQDSRFARRSRPQGGAHGGASVTKRQDSRFARRSRPQGGAHGGAP